MEYGERFDPAALFGSQVLDESGRRLGRVIALIHRADGCDVLVERRHWLRRVVTRLDLDDLVQLHRAVYVRGAGHRLSTGGPGDDRVA